MKNIYEKILSAFLYKGIFILALIFFFFKLYFFGIMSLLVFAFAWFLTKSVEKVRISKNYKLIIYIFLWTYLLGEFYFYSNTFYYDKISHFIIPIFITSMVYDYISKSNLKYLKTQIFFIVLGMLCAFEIFEYFMDIFLYNMVREFVIGGIRFSELHDTMWDLIFGALGSLIFLMYRGKK